MTGQEMPEPRCLPHEAGLLTVTALLQRWPEAEAVLGREGLAAFCTPEVRDGIGRFLRLETVLRRKGIDPEGFVRECLCPALSAGCGEERLRSQSDSAADAEAGDVFAHGGAPGSVLALLPCGMKRSFHAGVREFAEQSPQEYARLDCLIAGNLNYELSYYAHLARAASVREMPDLMVLADFNCFFHHDFLERFAQRGAFAVPADFPGAEGGGVSRVFQACAYLDPQNQYLMLTANPLVMVVDHALLRGRPAPRGWADLLAGDFRNDLTIRGDGSFFCNGVLLPLYRMAGMDGIRRLAAAVREGVHPSQMVKRLSDRSPQRTAVCIMPYFFAQTITGNPDCAIVWPAEGAVLSPVFLAARADRLDNVRGIIRYLAGERFGRILNHAHFPPLREAASDFDPATRGFYWVGWDFLRERDSARVKEEIEAVFVPEYRATLD